MRFEQLSVIGLSVEKVMIDPDELLAFARERHGGKINDIICHDFATMRAAKTNGDHEDSSENLN